MKRVSMVLCVMFFIVGTAGIALAGSHYTPPGGMDPKGLGEGFAARRDPLVPERSSFQTDPPNGVLVLLVRGRGVEGRRSLGVTPTTRGGGEKPNGDPPSKGGFASKSRS